MLKVKKVNLIFFLRVDEFFFLVGKRDCNLLLKGLERNLTKTLVELIHNHPPPCNRRSILNLYFLIHCAVIHRREYFHHFIYNHPRMHIKYKYIFC